MNVKQESRSLLAHAGISVFVLRLALAQANGKGQGTMFGERHVGNLRTRKRQTQNYRYYNSGIPFGKDNLGVGVWAPSWSWGTSWVTSWVTFVGHFVCHLKFETLFLFV